MYYGCHFSNMWSTISGGTGEGHEGKGGLKFFGGIGIWQKLGEFQNFGMRGGGEGNGKHFINLNIFSQIGLIVTY